MPRGSALLEIGAGQGAIGARLAQRYRYTGVEADPASAATARARIEAAGGRLLIGDAAEFEFDAPFDVVCAFEVLEHLEDDHAAARWWAGFLHPGGRLIVSVPAQPHRFGPWDAAVGHYRRYDRRGLTDVLAAGGFIQVDARYYGFPLGYVLETVRNRVAARTTCDGSLEQRTAASGRRLQPSLALSGAITCLATLPFRLGQRLFERTSLGTGIVATAALPGETH